MSRESKRNIVCFLFYLDSKENELRVRPWLVLSFQQSGEYIAMVKGWIGFTMIYPYWGMVINPFIDIFGHPPYGTPWGIPLVSLKLPCWFQSPPGWLNGQAWWELWGWSNVTWVKQDSKESRKETGISCTSEFETGSRWFNGSSVPAIFGLKFYMRVFLWRLRVWVAGSNIQGRP